MCIPDCSLKSRSEKTFVVFLNVCSGRGFQTFILEQGITSTVHHFQKNGDWISIFK